jgi:hypothetical protein
MLSKTQFLYFLQCPKYLWLYKNKKELLEGEDDLGYKQLQGESVEYWVYKDYPSGIDCKTEGTITDDIRVTEKVLASGAKVIFQSSFSDGELFCRNDLLVFDKASCAWDLIEIKATTKVEKIHIQDLAFQKECLMRCGLEIAKIFVYHINNDYVRRGDIDVEKLITKEDVTTEVGLIEASTRMRIGEALEFLKDNIEEPSVHILKQCSSPYDCGFINYCWKDIPFHSVYDLSLKESALKDHVLSERLAVEDVSFSDITRSNKKMYYLAKTKDEVIIDRTGIKEELGNIDYPVYFLDYESYSPAIPMFDRYKPYQQMVFQYSLHKQEYPDAPIEHYEFLSDSWEDPAPKLLEQMISDIDDKGSVLVWNESFEKSRNKEMAVMYPKYKEFLNSLNDRIYDLGLSFKYDYYVHKDFKGSWSIKSVLPVLVSELSYKELNIQGGSQASASYRELIDPSMDDSSKKALKEDMLKYCGLDTFAMVKILEKLREIADGR